MTGVRRVSAARVERLANLLGPRDRQILGDLHRVRVLTGAQLDRLHFSHVALTARDRTRRRTMSRLVEWRAVTSLERRVGGVRAGSAGLVFALDSAGQRVLERQRLAAGEQAESSRIRRPRTPRPLFLGHTLAVSELYVALRDVERRTSGLAVEAFDAEPAGWWPDGVGGWLKPDAYVALATADFVEHTWIEADRSTESLPTLRRKFLAYLGFINRGGLGPAGVVPRVLVTVPDQRRLDDVEREIRRLPPPGTELFSVALHSSAAEHLAAELLAPDEPA